MTRLASLLLAGLVLGSPHPAVADEANLSFGGDQFTAGQTAVVETAVPNDAFVAGYDVTLSAPTGGDAHLAGYNVTSNADVAGDLYAAGFNVTVNANVAGDISAMGNTLTLRTPAALPGNARLVGQNVVIGSGIAGSAIVTAQTLTLDAPIAGDFEFFGENLVFARGAKVDGSVAIHAPKEIAVPATVAAADRVRFEQLVQPDYVGEAGRTAQNVVNGFWPAFWAAVIWGLMLFVVGALFITLMQGGVAAMQQVAEKRPFRKIGLGILAFAATIGLVPVVALTIVGILLLPFVLIFVVIACALAYLAGTYFTGQRVAAALLPITSNIQRLMVLAVSLVIASVLSLVPMLGWLITLVLLTFGFGVITASLMVRWRGRSIPKVAAPQGFVPFSAASDI